MPRKRQESEMKYQKSEVKLDQAEMELSRLKQLSNNKDSALTDALLEIKKLKNQIQYD